ncbi:MAG: ribulose-phosphate 3-epimerase [Actinobacteria bacterium]|nr:MAG: ribulose-phosphate 3-epimerase [Actinomycetota bacterium]
MKRALSIAASVLAADFADLKNQLDAAASCGVDYIHVDVMDGHFVDNLTMGPVIFEALARLTPLPLAAHLMIENPERYAGRFVEAGAGSLSFHVEAQAYPRRLLAHVRSLGDIQTGIAINPATPVDAVGYLLDLLDFLLIMSVEPGFSGQEFIETSVDKIEEARRLVDARRLPVRIAVDGGISAENAADVVRAGADTLVVGSAIFGADDVCEAVEELKDGIRRGERETT